MKEKVLAYIVTKEFRNTLVTSVTTLLGVIIIILYNFMKSGFTIDNYKDPTYYVDSVFLVFVLWLFRYAWANRGKFTFRNSKEYKDEIGMINQGRELIDIQDTDNKVQNVIDNMNEKRKLKKYRTELSNYIMKIDNKLHALAMKKKSKKNIKKTDILALERGLLCTKRIEIDKYGRGESTEIDIEDFNIDYQPISKAVLFSESSAISEDDNLIMNTGKVFFSRNLKTNIMTTLLSLALVGLSTDAAIQGEWFKLFMMITLSVIVAVLSYTSMFNIERYENLPLVRKRKDIIATIITKCGFTAK
jgi:hypothetical protein